MPSAFISDGFTLTGKVEALPGIYDAFTFEYRPALPPAVADYHRRNRGARTTDEEMKIDAEWAMKYLVSWDLTDGRGNVVPLSAANFKLVHLSAQASVLNHINSYSPAQEAADLKNSSTASG